MNHAELGRWGNQLLAALPAGTLALLKRDLSGTTLPQGAMCFDCGDVVDRVYLPMSGLISLVVPAGGHHLPEAGLVGSEGAAGLQSAISCRPAFTRAVVQVPGKFWSVPAESLRQAVKTSDEAARLVDGYTELLWAEAQQLAACNAVHPALQRLARWLLQAADRNGSNQLPLTQEHLAETLGVRRTTVTLLEQQLQDRGLIKNNRANIVIVDRAGLEASACQCYQIIRQLYRREPQEVEHGAACRAQAS
jgi:CRP-like cAMP-binding protein